MEIAVSDAGEVKVIRIEGKLDTQSSPDAQAQLTQLIDQGATKLIVSLVGLSCEIPHGRKSRLNNYFG